MIANNSNSNSNGNKNSNKNSNMTTNKAVCRIQPPILYLTLLLWKFVNTVLLKFVGTFGDKLSALFITSSHIATESSILLAKFLIISQLHVAGFQI